MQSGVGVTISIRFKKVPLLARTFLSSLFVLLGRFKTFQEWTAFIWDYLSVFVRFVWDYKSAAAYSFAGAYANEKYNGYANGSPVRNDTLLDHVQAPAEAPSYLLE